MSSPCANSNSRDWAASARLVSSLLTVTVVLLGIVGASYQQQLTPQEYKKIKQQISQLPQGEYERLERNLKAFQQMSSDEQIRYQQMHQTITDRSLLPLVEEYNKWLGTLTPFERQKLRSSAEPSIRVAAVEEILRKKREQDEYRLPELIARMIEQGENSFRDLRWVLRQQDEFNFTHPYVLTNSQIDTFIDQVLLPQLTSSQQILFAAEPGKNRFERISEVLKASVSRQANPRETWPADETFRLLEQQGIILQGTPPEQGPRPGIRPLTMEQWRRIAFRRLLVRSLVVVQLQEFEKKYPIHGYDTLNNYFAKLDSSAQAILLDSPADYQAEALKWHYLWNTHRNESLLYHPEFREYVLKELLAQWGIERGGPGFRPDRPPGPDGRGGPRGPRGRPGEPRGPLDPMDQPGPDDRPGPPPELRTPPESVIQ